MKSSQINFFILPEDLLTFERILIKHGVLFIRQPIYDLNNIYTNSLQLSKNEMQFDKIFLTTKEFQQKVIIEKVEKQSYQLVNVTQSDVVEFSRGGFLYSNNKLERGRLYYIHSYFENNTVVDKNNEFKKWANNIISAIKKDILIKKKRNSIFYVSKNVENWITANNAIIDESGLNITIP